MTIHQKLSDIWQPWDTSISKEYFCFKHHSL